MKSVSAHNNYNFKQPAPVALESSHTIKLGCNRTAGRAPQAWWPAANRCWAVWELSLVTGWTWDWSRVFASVP